MSKVGFWLRGSKGKLGGSYLSKGPDGATVQHVIGEVKNPRTLAQMQQRMVMATAMAAYAGMKEIVDHSFEGVTYGQPAMSTFISYNAKMLREGLQSNNSQLAFNPYQDRNIYRNPYLVSKGTILNKSTVSIDEINGDTVVIDWNVPEIDGNTTLAQFLDSLGISQNGYITFLAIVNDPIDNISDFGWVRYTPKKDMMKETLAGHEVWEFFNIESNVKADNENAFTAGGRIIIPLIFNRDTYTCGCCGIILSDKKLGWQRSTCRMVVQFPDNPTYNPSPADQALATYPVGTDYVLNGGNV